MRTVKLVKVNPISAFKVGMGFGAVLGLISAVVYLLVSFIGGIAAKGILGGLGGGIKGIFFGILMGILYMIVSGFGCWLYALIYNVASKYIGAIEVEVTGI